MVTVRQSEQVQQILPSIRSIDITAEGQRRGFRPRTIRSGGGFRTGGSGGTITPTKPKPQTFPSEILGKTFSSASARTKAETSFRTEQSRVIKLQQEQIQSQRIQPKPEGRFGGTVVSAPPKQGFFIEQTQKARRGGGLRRGVIPILSLASLGGSFIRNPIQTSKSVGTGLFSVGKKVVTGQGFPSVGRLARDDPIGFTSQVGGELLLLKGSGAVLTKGGQLTRATGTRLRPGFVGTTELETSLGTKKVLGAVGGGEDIAIIPAGTQRKLPTLDPALRGGFGFTQAEQKAIIGSGGSAVTAQRSFLSRFKKTGTLSDDPFFATPGFKGTGGLRESRLGVTQPTAGIKDILFGDVTFKRQRPQILTFPGGKGFIKKPTPGTELEIISSKPAGTTVKGTRIGGTIIGGEGIPIFRGEFISSTKGIKPIKTGGNVFKTTTKTSTTPRVSTKGITTSSLTGFSRRTLTAQITKPTRTLLPSPTVSRPTTPTKPTTPTRPTNPFRPTRGSGGTGGTGGISPILSPSIKASPSVKPSVSLRPSVSPRLVVPRVQGKTIIKPPSSFRRKVRKPKVKRKSTKKVKVRREASLAAIGLDIRATSPFKSERTSLGIRPILTGGKKRAKKKKKNKK